MTLNYEEELDIKIIAANIKRIGKSNQDPYVIDQVKYWGEIAQQEHVDAILCRGGLRNILSNDIKLIPVMGMSFSGLSTVLILADYKMEFPEFFNERKKVCSISRKKIEAEAGVMEALFNVEMHYIVLENFRNSTEDEAYLMNQTNVRQFDLVVCGYDIQAILDKYGIPTCHRILPFNMELKNNFIACRQLAMSKKKLTDYAEDLKSLMDSSFDSIISIDQQCKIKICNQLVNQHFKKTPEELEGMDICELVPALSREQIQSVLEQDQKVYGRIVEIDYNAFVVNIVPYIRENVVLGAILHFDEFKRIENIEQKVRSEYLNKGLTAKYHFEDIIGVSKEITECIYFAKNFAKHSANVLLLGESGTGKELFSQSIHNDSLRKDGPFVAVNCGAIPNNLLESELFGYVGGAFTGASKNGKKGLIEMADHGTVFLDEISEMDLLGQVRLLRVLEERVVTRVGDDRVIPVDIRVISASNKNLKHLVQEGKFREDLYYRLNVLALKIPPLRERKGDIRVLTERLMARYSEKNKKAVLLEEEALDAVEQYSWSGNIRQLRNFCERLVIIANRPILSKEFVVKQLNDSYFDAIDERNKESAKNESFEGIMPTENHKKAVSFGTTGGDEPKNEEHIRLVEALNQVGGNRQKAAELLGISTTSLWRKMKKYGVGEKY